MPALFTTLVGSTLVGILKMLGWQSLILKVASDTMHYAAKKLDNELVKKVLDDVGDTLDQAKTKEP
jgi:hypothetical protein